MFLRNNYSKTMLLILMGTFFVLFINSCDNQITQPVEDPKSKNIATPERNFFSYTDSTNPILTIAVDTLRERNEVKSFTDKFIEDRGYPLWDRASAFYQQGKPIMLVPVTRPAKRMVTGIVYVSIVEKQPIFRWIPRKININSTKVANLNGFQKMMLIHQEQLFGEVKMSGINVESDREETLRPVPTYMAVPKTEYILVAYEVCGKVSAGDTGSYAEWQCDTFHMWVEVSVSGGGGGSTGGGFGGTGSGGSTGGGTGGDNGPPPCGDPIHGCVNQDPPAMAPEGVSQAFYEGLNDVEKALCVLDPQECAKVAVSKVTAEDWAPYQEPLSGDNLAGWNDPQDALRHTRWNAEMAKKIGSDRAKVWGDAHEYVAPDNDDPHANDPIARNMDLHNNQVGRDIGATYPNNIVNAILNARDNGELWLWRCRETQTRFGCGDTPQD